MNPQNPTNEESEFELEYWDEETKKCLKTFRVFRKIPSSDEQIFSRVLESEVLWGAGGKPESRAGVPSHREWYASGNLKSVAWFERYREQHQDEEPTKITYRDDATNSVQFLCWFNAQQQLSRQDQAARIQLDETKAVVSREWFVNGCEEVGKVAQWGAEAKIALTSISAPEITNSKSRKRKL